LSNGQGATSEIHEAREGKERVVPANGLNAISKTARGSPFRHISEYGPERSLRAQSIVHDKDRKKLSLPIAPFQNRFADSKLHRNVAMQWD
jgi:hypothetical protein